MKKTIALLLALTALLSLSACSGRENASESGTSADSLHAVTSPDAAADDTVIRVAVLNGTTGFGIAPLYADIASGKTEKIAEIEFYTDASLIPPMIVSGSADIAAVPTNLAPVLYNKTEGKIVVLAVNTLGVLYLLENGTTVSSLSDLAGKTVYVPGAGSNPEYVLRALLTKAGLADKVTIDAATYGTPDALTTAAASGLAPLALLPEPKVTAAMMQNSSLRVALDFSAEWKTLTGTELVQGCLIARYDFVCEHPNRVYEFLEEYQKSVGAVNADPAAAAGQIVAAGLAPKAALVENALPRCNITYLTGDAMKTALNEFWGALFAVIPSSVGGKLPDEKIFLPVLYG